MALELWGLLVDGGVWGPEKGTGMERKWHSETLSGK